MLQLAMSCKPRTLMCRRLLHTEFKAPYPQVMPQHACRLRMPDAQSQMPPIDVHAGRGFAQGANDPW